MLLEIKAVPNSKRFGLSFKEGWRVNLTFAPEKGRANIELEKELGRLLDCPVRVVSGARGRRKVLEVGLDENEFARRTKAYRKAKEP
jgi:uncharacterized protein YggU (UPF0235/DUF167 family)